MCRSLRPQGLTRTVSLECGARRRAESEQRETRAKEAVTPGVTAVAGRSCLPRVSLFVLTGFGGMDYISDGIYVDYVRGHWHVSLKYGTAAALAGEAAEGPHVAGLLTVRHQAGPSPEASLSKAMDTIMVEAERVGVIWDDPAASTVEHGGQDVKTRESAVHRAERLGWRVTTITRRDGPTA